MLRLGDQARDSLFVYVLTIISAIFSGVLIANFELKGAIAIAVAVVYIVVIKFIARNYVDAKQLIFVLCIYSGIIFALILKVSTQNYFGIWQIAILLIGFLGAKNFFSTMEKSTLLKLFLISFILFLILGVVSTITGRSKLQAGLYQFLSNLKPILLIFSGFYFFWSYKIERTIQNAVNWLWLPICVLIALEWLVPNQYRSLFPGIQSIDGSIDPTGLFPSRAMGLYEHPSFLANAAAIFSMISIVSGLYLKTKNLKSYVIAGIYLAIIVFSVQRQELVAYLVSVALIYLIRDQKTIIFKGFLTLVLSFIIFTALFSIYSENIKKEAQLWGYGSTTRIEHPRSQIIVGAIKIADQYAPLGSGLGTYGGAGAAKFDNSLYLDLGFGNYWWFGKKGYLLDTYWPNSIAESGYFGAGLLLLSYLSIFFYCLKNTIYSCNENHKRYWAISTGLWSYILITSATSPSFQDPRLFLIPAIYVGIAFGRTKSE